MHRRTAPKAYDAVRSTPDGTISRGRRFGPFPLMPRKVLAIVNASNGPFRAQFRLRESPHTQWARGGKPLQSHRRFARSTPAATHIAQMANQVRQQGGHT